MSALSEKKRKLIQQVVDATCAHSAGLAADVARNIVTAAYEHLALDELRSTEFEELCGAARSILEMARVRSADHPEIRVYNPVADSSADTDSSVDTDSSSDTAESWGSERTVIEVLTNDRPFLVDSFCGEINRRDLTIHLAVHPQLAVKRDASGELAELVPLGSKDEGVVHESLMHYQVDRLSNQAALVDLETSLRKVLADIKTSVDDYEPMRAACLRAIEELAQSPPPTAADETAETVEFLRWVAADHFTFLGFLEYDLVVEEGEEYLRPRRDSGLGLLQRLPLQEKALSRLPLAANARRFLHGAGLVLISKSNKKSSVHRNVQMDVISLKRFSAAGEVNGELRFEGLFTSRAYSIAVSQIPLVRRKVQRVVERTRFLPASHNAKMLRHIVEQYPRDELFQTPEEDLYTFAMRLLELELRPRTAMLVRRDLDERYVSCMVYTPRERHNTRSREDMQRILEESFGGELTAYYTRVADRPLAQLHFILKTRPGMLPDYNLEEIEQRLSDASMAWPDLLREVIVADESGDLDLASWRRYREAFPSSYQHHFGVDDALRDIPKIDAVLDTGKLALRLYRRPGAAEDHFHLHTFELAVQRPLSEFLPMLENMGLRVQSEIPFEVRPVDTSNPVWVRSFEVVAESAVDLAGSRQNFKDAFCRVYGGEVESDGFNKLVLRAGLNWRQASLIRAYCKYLRQTGIVFSQRYMHQTLARYPEVATKLVELFVELFDPAAQEGVDRSQLVLGEIHQCLEKVSSLDDDRILRRFLNLIQSTVRTNYFQPGDDGPKEYLSIKLDAAKVSELPSPRPEFEIFVYSPRVEAVHLRGGKVARGGIRWSDRLEDFRTEILGLVKSQMVKNAVIVPVGAKGGFIVKRPPVGGDREAMLAEGIRCYKTMIRGLLDITDNLRGSEVVPARDVVRRDGDDPYLVVAADKGTATFSDLANELAAEYGFWLGDAFASGGSVGYDHKKMGITAKGAWESVKRHFREMGQNIQEEPFSAVGVGDMSGDVFGNGMLLSKQTRLVAAFNHMHIFVDPNPDAASSWTERQRLFDLPRSTWADYDRSLLSEGGDIFERKAKRITVSTQVKECLGLSLTELTPGELIKAILCAKVDLLWFGGIGTYVKSTTETHADADDRSNDEVRVNGAELACRVVGEGANLGLTQLGRVEYALRGGRLNTDFIDNSGGVDCSDHEVNIKIALRDAVGSGQLSPEERDSLLVEMTDEVSRLVLRDNYLQSQAITLVQYRKSELIDSQARLMRNLERAGRLDRRLEFLPDDSTLLERKQSKQGLTRPEIAVILAYAKISVYNHLLDSDLPDDDLMLDDLTRYFPAPMRGPMSDAIQGHRLRREIIATHVTNSIVNRVGPSFMTRIIEETSRPVSDIARAYIAARDIFELRSLWQEIQELDNKIAADEQSKMLLLSVDLVATVIRWFLRYCGRSSAISHKVQDYEANIVVVAAQLEHLLPSGARAKVRRRRRRLIDIGVGKALASRIASMDILPSVCDVARCAVESGEPVERVGKAYFSVGEKLGFDRLRRTVRSLASDSPYQQAAMAAILDDLAGHQSQLTVQVVGFEGKVKTAMEGWVASRPDAVQRLQEMMSDFEIGRADFAMLTIAERAIRRLVEI